MPPADESGPRPLSLDRLDRLDRLDLPAFCRLATELARDREPSFPELEPSPLEFEDDGYCRSRADRDTRIDGVGWQLSIVAADVGPAESIHDERWSAVAHGDGWTVELRLKSVGDTIEVWIEPPEPDLSP